jgi:hypothetical protein
MYVDKARVKEENGLLFTDTAAKKKVSRKPSKDREGERAAFNNALFFHVMVTLVNYYDHLVHSVCATPLIDIHHYRRYLPEEYAALRRVPLRESIATRQQERSGVIAGPSLTGGVSPMAMFGALEKMKEPNLKDMLDRNQIVDCAIP